MADTRGIQNAERTMAESTEPYRGPLREVSAAERWTRPVPPNSKKPPAANEEPARVARTIDRRRAAAILARAAAAGGQAKVASRAGLMSRIILFTVKIYIVQIFFGILSLIGFAILGGQGSYLLSAADFITFGTVENAGGGLFLLGAAGAFICGFLTFLVTAPFFGQKNLALFGPIIAAACLAGLLCPVLNLFPLMWLWCLYMVLSADPA